MSNKEQSLSPLQVSPQPTLKIAKSERTRAVILNSALNIIWSHPFRDMTVKSLIQAFVQHPRSQPKPIREALVRITGWLLKIIFDHNADGAGELRAWGDVFPREWKVEGDKNML